MSDQNRDDLEARIFLWSFCVVLPLLGLLGLALGCR